MNILGINYDIYSEQTSTGSDDAFCFNIDLLRLTFSPIDTNSRLSIYASDVEPIEMNFGVAVNASPAKSVP